MLKKQGIKKGDRICFYMPMIPQVAIAMLACARIWAIHSIVFAGFSANPLADRIKDAECKVVICSDYNRRGPKIIPVKEVVDEDPFRKEILATVTKHISPIAKPDMKQFMAQLPKNRSGEIMRRILRKIAEGQIDQLGDTSTLINPESVEELTAGALV